MKLEPIIKLTTELVLNPCYVDIETGEEYGMDKTFTKKIKTGKRYKQVPEKTTKNITYDLITKTFTYWKEQEK